MEGPISFWGYKEKESKPILPEHDGDDDDDDDDDGDEFRVEWRVSRFCITA
jgi:hypothetical protein